MVRMFDQVKGRFQRLELAQKSLLLVLVAFAGLCVFRALHLSLTSFFVSDEYRYVRDAMAGEYVDPVVARRFLFTTINAVIFQALGIHTMDQFVVLLPFYLFLWGSTTIVAFYKIMKLMDFDPKTIALALVSSLALISFTLLSLGFLTEPSGLAWAMLGIYLSVWYAKKGGSSTKSLAAPAMAATCFALAAFTREPFYIFLLGGIFVFFAIALTRAVALRGVPKRNVYAAAAVVLFTVPSVVFLYYPNNAFGAVLPSILPTPAPPGVYTTTTTTTTTTSSTISVSTASTTTYVTTVTVNGTVHTSTVTSTIATTSSVSTSSPPPNPVLAYLSAQWAALQYNHLFASFKLFFLGLVLGWGPLLFIFGVSGILIMLRNVFLRRRLSLLYVLMFIVVGLGSFFVLSYLAVVGVFSGNDYFNFQNYSTLIRFADPATPAYLLAAPFIFAIIGKSRKLIAAALIVLVVFGVAAGQEYQAYAASNLGVSGNPFSLDYRTGGALVRDYIASHQTLGPFHVVGFWPETWRLTTGTSGIDPSLLDFHPNVTLSEFVQARWTTFYVYTYSVAYLEEAAPFLVSTVYPHTENASAPPSFQVRSENVIYNSSVYFIQFHVQWIP